MDSGALNFTSVTVTSAAPGLVTLTAMTETAGATASDGVASAATAEALPHRGTAAPARWVMSSAPACVWAVPAAAPTVTGTAAGEVAPVAYG